MRDLNDEESRMKKEKTKKVDNVLHKLELRSFLQYSDINDEIT